MERVIDGKLETPNILTRGVQNLIDSGLLETGKVVGFRLEGKEKLEIITGALEDPSLQTLIDEGKITLGAIKPQTQDSKLNALTDDEGEKILLSMVKPPLKPLFSVSITLTTEDVDIFYSNIRQKLSAISEADTNAWELFKKYMLSGPVTYFMLSDSTGNAVSAWRNQMGATDPSKATMDTIRGQFARNIQKNLVHGSSGDTKEEGIKNVKKETRWLYNKLMDQKVESQQLTKEVLDKASAFENTDVQPQKEFLNSILIPWAEGLPKPTRILEVAAGQGVEAAELAKKGFDVVAVEKSKKSIETGFHSQFVYADAGELPFDDSSFSGIYLKDAIVFFPPKFREQVFAQARRVLVPGGSFLISSQLSERLRMYMIPNGSTYPVTETIDDDKNWEDNYAVFGKKNNIFSTEFVTNPQAIKDLAEKSGFSVGKIKEYNFDDPLALENRWIKRSGFVIELVKPL